MPVPKEIREVPRPKNTIVECRNTSGNNKYAVRERTSIKYVKGSNPQPHNGKVIGHIIDMKFVPVTPKVNKNAEMFSYGASALIKSIADDVFEDLLKVYPVNTATTIMAIAFMKIEKPSIKVARYRRRYEESFTSLYYPGAALSQTSVSSMFYNLGTDEEKRINFFKHRFSRISKEQHVILDGTLKENNSIVNDLSHFSYKSRIKGTKDISIVYAYNLETKEPICAEVYPGNYVNSNAYESFVEKNEITRGILIDDKGFPVNKIENWLNNHEDLHYLTPIKRSDTRIANNKMLDFEEIIPGIKDNILCKKKQIKGGKYLYSFKDTYKSSKEMMDYVERKKLKEFDPNDYAKTERRFGTIVFESDLDMTCAEVYQCYSCRWELELLFKAYKSNIELTTTNVQHDFSVYGLEFVNFISALLTRKVINKLSEFDLLNDDTFGGIMEDLSMAWRRHAEADELNEIPSSSDKKWIHTNIQTMDILKKLGLASK